MTGFDAAAWSALADRIRCCVACPELAATRSSVVAGDCPPSGSRVLLVGEAPGAQEDLCGVPFVGKAGRLLDTVLEEVGLPRSQVAVANVLKCRPPNNRRPTRGEVARCRGWLARQIELIDPAVIGALGGTAVEWFFGAGAKIGALRGVVHRLDGRAVVATYHPSAAIRFGPLGMPLAALRADLAMVTALVNARSAS